MTTNIYSEMMAKKRPWQVVKGTKGQVVEGSEATLGKALALRVLEIPVGDWILDGVSRETDRLPVEAIDLLLDNQKDELKHDEVLSYAANLYQFTTDDMESEGQAISKRWLEHPDHPIVKAGVLESSIFFVILPMLRFFGDSYLRTTANDISNDEVIHAKINRYVATELGYTWSKSLDILRRDTIEWLVEDLEVAGKWGNPNLWLESSESLMHQMVAPKLQDTQRFTVLAPMEINNTNMPQYY